MPRRHCSSENVELPLVQIRQLMVNVLLSVFLLISYGHVFSSIDLPPDVMILFDDDFVVMNLTEVFFEK